MGKGACIKRILAVINYSTNTVMKKKKQAEGEGGWRVKNMEFSGGKSN